MESAKIQIKPLSCVADWPIWKRRIRDYMDYHEGTIDVIDGKLKEPEALPDDATDEQRRVHKQKVDLYRKANSYAKSVIANTVTEDTYQKIMDRGNACEVWNELKRNFEASQKDQLFQVCSNFFSFDWISNLDVSGQIAKLKTLWNELNNGLEAVEENKLPELLLVCKVLNILPRSFQTFKSSWLLLSEERRSLDELITQLCAFERDNMKNDVSSDVTDALAVNTLKQKQKFEKSSKEFQHRKVTGKCHYCHKPGHYIKSCRKWIADGRPPKNPESRSNPENAAINNVLCTTVCEIQICENSCDWYIDNGATRHITNNPSCFVDFQKFTVPHTVQSAGKELLTAVGKGTVRVISRENNKQLMLSLSDVWYVPSINLNLFSVLAAQDRHLNNSQFVSTATECCLSINNQVWIRGTRQVNGSLYKSNLMTISPEKPVEINVATDSSTLQLYHERFGHQDKRHVKSVLQKELNINVRLDKELCEPCVYGKSHRLTFGNRNNVTQVGELFSADICGPFDQSFSKKKYFVIFKDHFSKMRFISFLSHKSEAKQVLEDVIALAKTQGHIIKELLSDNGGEFDNDEFRSILRRNGITQRLTAPYTPQQNGGSERENRTIVEMARTLKYSNPEAEFPVAMWAELCSSAVYILNRTGKSSVEGVSPYELWYRRKPRIKHLRIIGSVCYSHIPDQKRHKMNKKAFKGYLIGYDGDERYRIWLKEQYKVIFSRDVIFQEKPKICDKEVEINFPSNSTTEVQSNNEDQLIESSAENTDTDSDTDSNSEDNTEIPATRQLRERSSLKKPKKFDDFVMSVQSAEAWMLDIHEPESYEEAIQSRESIHWKEAMNREMNSLNENQTWELCELPTGAKLLPCKWVYKVKMNSDGSINKYKARLVAKGYNQRFGIDYNQTFSPVAKMPTIRSLLSIAANEKLHLVQFDVSTAFLYGKLDEVIYIKQPDGYNDNTNKVCKLLRSLYGLKQAPRCWNECFGKFLINQGFTVSDADPCLYIRNQDGKLLIIALYVDDGLVAATDTKDLDQFTEQLKSRFKVVVRPATYFLGLEITTHSNYNITISQSAYSQKLLKRFRFEDCKPVSTPMLKGTDLTQCNKNGIGTFPYRQAVGALLYLMTGTRPDIAYSVSYLSRSLENPTQEDITRVKRVFRYIAGTIHKSITYKSEYSGKALQCYSDADFGGCNLTGRSTSGVVIMYSGGIISWLSQRQATVATSTTEAEIIASTEAVKEIIWLKRLFESLHIKLTEVPVLQVDNSAAVKLAQNPEFHRRTKHIDIKNLFVREKVIDGTIKVLQISTEHQLADIMTKPVNRIQINKICLKIGLC